MPAPEARGTEDALRRRLEERLGEPVALRVNDNMRLWVAVKWFPGRGYRMNVHHRLVTAPDDVHEALARFAVRRDQESRQVPRDYIGSAAPGPDSGGVIATGRGAQELRERADRLNRDYFNGALTFSICWGRRPRRRPTRIGAIRLGSCAVRTRDVRVHPLLDSPRVPGFYLDYIIHHELCHIAIPPEKGPSGRMIIHGPKFRAMEANYENRAEALAWQKANLRDLLLRWVRGEDLRRPVPRRGGTPQESVPATTARSRPAGAPRSRVVPTGPAPCGETAPGDASEQLELF